ncbi:hypothetical protein IH982_02295 [Patescibacteria group bacterium]|nr:hypothetical protein [Patescibacteria group bacterium]
MVEIIPKVPQTSSLFMRVFFALSIGVFVLSVGGFVLLFFLESRTQTKIKEAEILLRTEKTPEQAQLEQDMFVARTRLKDFATLVELRKDVLPAFSFLENVVHPEVTFLSMNVDVQSHTVQLRGTAESFSALDEQLVVLEARSEPGSISLTNLKLGGQGGVDFQMEIQFSAAFFQ